MKQKILDLLPRAGALLVAVSILLCCVVPARAASTSEAVTYYDILNYNMSGTVSSGKTVSLSFAESVADYASLYTETYDVSDWSLLITGEFDNTVLKTTGGAVLSSSTLCSYRFSLTSDWIKSPKISCVQDYVGETGYYRITGAYLVSSTYVSKYSAYYYQTEIFPSLSSVYSNRYNSDFFSLYTGSTDIASINAGSEETLIFTPRSIIPCSTLYFEFWVEGLLPEYLNVSVVSLSSSGAVSQIHDCEVTLLTSAEGYYLYTVEAIGPFTETVFALISYATDDFRREIDFDGFYVGYNRVLNTNSLLDGIREQVTQSRVYLGRLVTTLNEISTNISSILQEILDGNVSSGNSASTNIFDSWNATITGLSGNFQSVVNAVEGIAGDITSGLSSSIKSISTAVDGIAGDITSGLSSSIKSISTAVDGIAGSVTSGLSSSINSISTAVDGIAGSVTSGLSSSINSISTAVDGIAGSVADSLASSFDSLTDATSSIAGSVVDGLASSFDSLTEATSSIAGDIIDGLPDIVGELSDIPGKIKAAFTPSWQTDAFGIVDFSSVLDIFTSGYNSISGLFGFQDIFEDPEGGIDWLPSGKEESSDQDPDTITFVTGISAFWTFSGDLVAELPLEVILVFSFVFIGFIFVGFLKSF